jgi:hypothetical protein
MQMKTTMEVMMKVRRWLLTGTAIGAMTFGGSALFSTGASAGTANPYGSGGGGSSAPAGIQGAITGPHYDFCNVNGCPLTEWTVDYVTHRFKDSFVPSDHGTFTHSGSHYTFVFPNVGGTGISCTFLGIKDATGFDSAANPGTYTCTDGTNTVWYALNS